MKYNSEEVIQKIRLFLRESDIYKEKTTENLIKMISKEFDFDVSIYFYSGINTINNFGGKYKIFLNHEEIDRSNFLSD